MTDLMTDFAPIAAMMFVAACVLWLVWRAIRSLFRSPARARDDIPVHREPDGARREPVLGPSTQAAPAPSTIPDAADVLALKASIDALTRQIAALEKRLTPANTNVPVTLAPRHPREARMEASADAPVVVPDRRI